MIDEHFMRDWNAAHDVFSADITRRTAKLRRCDSCASPVGGRDLHRQQANRIVVAILAGLLAGVLTAAAAAVATVDSAASPVAAAAAIVRPLA